MSVSIAFIPLAARAKLSPTAVRADFAAKWSDLPAPEPFKAEQDQMAFRVGDSDVIIAFMRAPIPWPDLEGPGRTSWLWKDAETALRNHSGHLIVTVISHRGPVEQSRLLTQVCASLLASCEQARGCFGRMPGW